MRKRAPTGSFGYRVRQRRERLELTQIQLAERAGIGQSALSSIETGDVKWSRGPNLLRLAAALESDPTWLETGVGEADASSDTPDAVFLAIYANLTPANRKTWLSAGRGILADQAKQPASDFPVLPKRAKPGR